MTTIGKTILVLTISSILMARSQAQVPGPLPTTQAAAGAFVEVEGSKLYYEECGTGPEAVVLIHDGIAHLAILELAAKESEAKVDEALRGLLEKGEGWVRAGAVRERLRAERKGSIRDVQVASVDLRLFDELCGSGEVLQ